MSRKIFEGTLCVYRISSLQDFLSAEVEIDRETVHYFHRCPKCFDGLIVDGTHNVAKIRYTANLDGSNPRSAVLIDKPYSPR